MWMGFWCTVLCGSVSRFADYSFSNSHTQKEYISSRAVAKGLKNLKVITGDVVDYELEACSFDRVVSIKPFEHLKNYGKGCPSLEAVREAVRAHSQP